VLALPALVRAGGTGCSGMDPAGTPEPASAVGVGLAAEALTISLCPSQTPGAPLISEKGLRSARTKLAHREQLAPGGFHIAPVRW